MGSLVTSQLRQRGDLSVTSQEDIKNLLGFEKQKQMLNCVETSCLAEVGGALGVDQMVTGSLNKIGVSYVLVLRAVDVKHAQVIHDFTRRVQGSPDALLDAPSPRPSRPSIRRRAVARDSGGAQRGPAERPPFRRGEATPPGGSRASVVGSRSSGRRPSSGSWPPPGGKATTYAAVNTADQIGYVGQGALIGGAVAGVAGLTWGLLSGSGSGPTTGD